MTRRHGFHKRLIETPSFWQHDAPWRVVASAAVSLPWIVRVRRVLNLGSVSRHPLPVWPLPFAVLFAGVVRRSDPQLVWGEASVVSGMASVVTRADHPLGAGRVPPDLLLLPRSILQIVLG